MGSFSHELAPKIFCEVSGEDGSIQMQELPPQLIKWQFNSPRPLHLSLNILQVYRLGMYGADYAWILHETMGPPWWQQSVPECSQWELEQAVEHLIIVSSHNSIVGGASSISGLVSATQLCNSASSPRNLIPSIDHREVPGAPEIPCGHGDSLPVRPSDVRCGMGHGPSTQRGGRASYPRRVRLHQEGHGQGVPPSIQSAEFHGHLSK